MTEEVLYPWGYGTTMIDEATLWARLGKAHPEFRRRAFALIVAGRGVIGVGNLWRSSTQQAANYARDPKAFAPAGSSFHETQTFASGVKGANAIDFVGTDSNEDGVRSSTEHRAAWKFLAENAAAYGLVEFSGVNGEPWHGQSSDIPISVRKWKSAGRPDPDPNFVLPDGAPALAPAPSPAPAPAPSPAPAPAPSPPSIPNGRLVLVNAQLPELKMKTGPKAQVVMLQEILNSKGSQGLTVDGDFGKKTDTAVRNWQTFFGLGTDGIVGPKTWKSLLELPLS